MQGEYAEVYPSSGKRRPYVQREGGVLYFLAPKCLRRGLQAVREGADPRSQREKVRVQRRLFEMLIFYGGVVTSFFRMLFAPFVESPVCPFIGSRGGRDAGGALEVKFCRTLWRLL
jgi:ribosomal protein L24E